MTIVKEIFYLDLATKRVIDKLEKIIYVHILFKYFAYIINLMISLGIKNGTIKNDTIYNDMYFHLVFKQFNMKYQFLLSKTFISFSNCLL